MGTSSSYLYGTSLVRSTDLYFGSYSCGLKIEVGRPDQRCTVQVAIDCTKIVDTVFLNCGLHEVQRRIIWFVFVFLRYQTMIQLYFCNFLPQTLGVSGSQNLRLPLIETHQKEVPIFKTQVQVVFVAGKSKNEQHHLKLDHYLVL